MWLYRPWPACSDCRSWMILSCTTCSPWSWYPNRKMKYFLNPYFLRSQSFIRWLTWILLRPWWQMKNQVKVEVVWQVEPLHPRWNLRSSGRWSHCIYINMSQVLLYGNYDMSQNNATSKTKVKAMKQSNIPLVTRRHEHKQQRRIENVWTKRKTWDHFIFKTILTTHKQMNRVSRTQMQER